MRFFPTVLTISLAVLPALLTAQPADAQSRSRPRPEVRSDWNQNVQGRRDGDVFVFGRNMGTDPDPRIRYQIKRDMGAATGGDD